MELWQKLRMEGQLADETLERQRHAEAERHRQEHLASFRAWFTKLGIAGPEVIEDLTTRRGRQYYAAQLGPLRFEYHPQEDDPYWILLVCFCGHRELVLSEDADNRTELARVIYYRLRPNETCDRCHRPRIEALIKEAS